MTIIPPFIPANSPIHLPSRKISRTPTVLDKWLEFLDAVGEEGNHQQSSDKQTAANVGYGKELHFAARIHDSVSGT